jgi:hypothetical protein
MAAQRQARATAAKTTAKTAAKTRSAPAAKRPKPALLRTAVEVAAVREPTHLLKLSAPKPGEIKAVEAEGPLLLLGAQVVMGGTSGGVSQVGVEIDGELVMVLRPDQHAARGLVMPNATGAFVTHSSFGSCWTVVLGWPYPVKVASTVKVSVMVMEAIGELEMALFLGRQ